MENQKEKRGSSVTRRDFLKGFGSGAVGATIVPQLLAQDAASFKNKGTMALQSALSISLTVNGTKHSLTVEPRETLLDVLRERLNLTGTKRICNQGECGGCTVLIDGKAIYSCLYPAFRAHGREITTVEGLAKDEKLHPVQQAFIDTDAYQCGFCTPGFIMSSLGFLQTNPNPNLEEIKGALSGNICRCGNYQNIYKALSEAARKMRRS